MSLLKRPWKLHANAVFSCAKLDSTTTQHFPRPRHAPLRGKTKLIGEGEFSRCVAGAKKHRGQSMDVHQDKMEDFWGLCSHHVASKLPAAPRPAWVSSKLKKNKGALSDIAVASALVDLQVKMWKRANCSSKNAWGKNAVPWTAMISRFAQNGFVETALELFQANTVG
ncbi:hypothetical protein KI387_018770, partial [Taxus chinensis]